MASKTIIKQRTTTYITGIYEDTYIKIIYYKNFEKSFYNYFAIQGLKLNSFKKVENVLDVLKLCDSNTPVSLKIWKFNKRFFKMTEEILNGNLLPIELLILKGEIYLIKTVKQQNKCEFCGTIYSNIHNCSSRRRDFYYHNIHHETKLWWEKIKFNPVGAIKAKRLFIVYDIETYTYHSLYGKQLTPYLLVFKLIGCKSLIKIASKIATDIGYEVNRECFVMLNKKEDEIGIAFKKFRTELQISVAKKYWSTFCENHGLESNLSYEDIMVLNKEKKLKQCEPRYIELYVVGHNICGFDEIILASHVLEGIDSEELSMFKLTRSFMPRAGKLLFNDITLSLPNPCFKKPSHTTYERWKNGIINFEDMKWQGIKFMVRDTFLLTHSSLRDAATAYQLSVSKGYCPYRAINDFFMLGEYEKENNGYPVQKYWNSFEEYLQNKPKHNQKYNLLEEAKEYCIDDVIVTAQLVEKLIEGYQEFCTTSLKLECSFNIFQRPTISSNTQALFKQIFYNEEDHPSEFLRNLEAPSEKMYDFVRMSLRGGRCYPSFLGIFEEAIYVYDICGMYASALTHPLPYGKTLNAFEANAQIDYFQELLQRKEKIDYFDNSIKPMIVVADCEPPSLDYLDVLPPLCSKKSGKLCWSNETLINEVLTSIDLITLHNRGWKCKIIKSSEMYAVWSDWKPLCQKYVKVNIMAKEKASKSNNKIQRSISKLLSNALYGSFATRIDKKKVVFAENIEEKDKKRLENGSAEITSYTTVISKSLPKRSFEWNQYFSNLPEMPPKDSKDTNENFNFPLFIGNQDHVTFKPITFLSADCNDLILTTIEDKEEWIKNNRYPTQIASFVLAWTRAFMSEWAEILYGEDMGKPYIEREIKSIYGDTDSLFLTEKGHQLMLSKGLHRLKKYNSNLIFDEKHPCLTWLVECETVCNRCGAEAFSSETCILAPKLYALKDITCKNCKFIGEGKLRAKGHAKNCLNYEILKHCFTDYNLLEQPQKEFQTSRKSLKKTLQTASGTDVPFTVVEKQLTRILRPWKDQTMRKGIQWKKGYLLYPYDKRHPNPRPQEPLTENPFWENF
ncbi:pol [Ovine adenovirus 7]|uniref:DNA polymerase n=1 Tax=Ovine adenovirus D serotype 7 (isolate OAV287) TaxID=114430 RepID=Q83895_ADEO7|nr:pol [Ovine adenovirus 7]AAD45950.1 pol [Ovine adenovirus 7]